MTAWDDAIAFTLRYEGGYSNHPADRGGPTRFGITERFARAHGYQGDMRQLPLELAKKWYKEALWDRYRFGEIAAAPAGYLFDMSVNHGRWTRIAQRAAVRFVGLTIDGVWGPRTHAAFIAAAASAGPFVDALRVERCRYALELVDKKASQGVFLLGWMRRYLAA